jgi:hypothetical protein
MDEISQYILKLDLRGLYISLKLTDIENSEYNLFLHYLFCLGLISDFWHYLELLESHYASTSPRDEKWGREQLEENLKKKLKSTDDISDLFNEFHEEKAVILESQKELYKSQDSGLIPLSIDRINSHSLTKEEIDELERIRLNFIESYSNKVGLVEKYILDEED